MKIKKAFEICKKQGVIRIYRNDYDEQYLSDGLAIYPIFELPNLNEDYICRLYDITDSQREKIAFDIVKVCQTLMYQTQRTKKRLQKYGILA